MSRTFAKRLKKRIEGFQFEVGVLQDKEHRLAKETPLFGQPDLGSYAGGPVRKATRVGSGKTVGDVLIENQERMGVNLLLEPFKDKSSDMMRFVKAFLISAITKKGTNFKRVENLLQAVVRNPILRGDYGPNSSATADAKGFNRPLIDTAQTFKSITAKVKRV